MWFSRKNKEPTPKTSVSFVAGKKEMEVEVECDDVEKFAEMLENIVAGKLNGKIIDSIMSKFGEDKCKEMLSHLVSLAEENLNAQHTISVIRPSQVFSNGVQQ